MVVEASGREVENSTGRKNVPEKNEEICTRRKMYRRTTKMLKVRGDD